mmetsp:Transcript_54690/g.119321  ORF Transcript_54690/g.119321 Transcript_54690/m.119321 type:complete len:381 (-) Transcript_54690:430-1572(-)
MWNLFTLITRLKTTTAASSYSTWYIQLVGLLEICNRSWCHGFCLSSLHIFHNQRRSASTAVANSSNSEAPLALLENAQQSHHDSSSAAADWMPECNSAPMHVHLGRRQAEQFAICNRHHRKSFVDFKEVHLVHLKPGILHCLRNGKSRGCREQRRRLLGICISLDRRKHRGAVGVGGVARHEDERGGAVGEGRGVGGGDRAADLLEGGPRFGGRALLRLRLLVGIDSAAALAARHDDGLHLRGEVPRRVRRARTRVRLVGVRVLLRAVDAERLSAQLRERSHVAVVVHVPQPVRDHAVHHLPMAHPMAPARLREVVRRVAHALHPARHDHVGLSEHDLLCAEHHSLDPTGAHLVDCGAASRIGKLRKKGRLASWRLSETS